jgi:hypothetical protein
MSLSPPGVSITPLSTAKERQTASCMSIGSFIPRRSSRHGNWQAIKPIKQLVLFASFLEKNLSLAVNRTLLVFYSIFKLHLGLRGERHDLGIVFRCIEQFVVGRLDRDVLYVP